MSDAPAVLIDLGSAGQRDRSAEIEAGPHHPAPYPARGRRASDGV